MGGLLTTVRNSANALSVYTREFDVIQNNIANANTPGYASQSMELAAAPFDLAQRDPGGVMPGPLISARSEYLEQNVRNQQGALGNAQQMAADLGQVQALFNPNATDGVAVSLSNFFNSFSQLSVNPNDASSRQAVLTAAGQVAQSFNQTAGGIAQISAGIRIQTSGAVSQINQLASRIAAINQQYLKDASSINDPNLDAQMHAALESLSQIANFTVVKGSDGTCNIYLGGQAPLVLGGQTDPISASFGSGKTVIEDAQSNDITSQISGGSLGATLQENNTILPGYVAKLNTLAQTFADQVNGQLASGLDQSGNPPSTPLFAYQAGNAAATLAVNSLTPDQIAAASAGAPGGNGNAIAVANLENANAVSGVTFAQAFGNLSAQVGSDVANAQQNQSEDQDLLTQAEQQRQQSSGVDLNAEAAKILQFQQSYQAVGQFVTVLSNLTQTLLNIIPPGAYA